MNNKPINKWERMEAKMKVNFLPKDYKIMMYRQAGTKSETKGVDC